ncbi:MAG: hypothetical protein HZB50_19335 [Chloroflexi bacterium]|nr:hypothetical protein [Chloroflexota bacterium]
MKRITLLVAVMIAMMIVSACGSAAPAATQAPLVQQPSATEPSVQPAATEPAAAAPGIQVDITLGDNTIDSSLTTFQVGVPYTFVITNKGNHAHNFNIAQPITVTGSLNAALQSALLAVQKNQLGGGAQVTVQFTFPDSAASTQLEFSCLIQRHYDDGMKLPITVTK